MEKMKAAGNKSHQRTLKNKVSAQQNAVKSQIAWPNMWGQIICPLVEIAGCVLKEQLGESSIEGIGILKVAL